MTRYTPLALLLLPVIAVAQYYGTSGPEGLGSRRVPTDANLNGVRFEQKPGNQVALDAVLYSEIGEEITFGSLLRGRPVLLVPIFYACEGVCNNELNELVSTIRAYGVDELGKDFDIVTLSINPQERPVMAMAKQAAYLREVGRPDAAADWRFLTGEYDQIRAVTDAIGFYYTYDEKTGDIEHPAGTVLLTPEGKVSKYLFRPDIPYKVLQNAVADADAGQVTERVDKPFYLSCIEIDPLTGRVTVNILNTVKVGGILTVLSIVGGVVYLTVKGRREGR